MFDASCWLFYKKKTNVVIDCKLVCILLVIGNTTVTPQMKNPVKSLPQG
jgi:hypothetical protein